MEEERENSKEEKGGGREEGPEEEKASRCKRRSGGGDRVGNGVAVAAGLVRIVHESSREFHTYSRPFLLRGTLLLWRILVCFSPLQGKFETR